MISGLLFRLGDVEALDGNRARAIEFVRRGSNGRSALAVGTDQLRRIVVRNHWRTGDQHSNSCKRPNHLSHLVSGKVSEGDLTEEEYKRLIAKISAAILRTLNEP
jgi:hypothetical protein